MYSAVGVISSTLETPAASMPSQTLEEAALTRE